MWVMGQNPSARLQMNRMGGEVNNAPAGCAVTQRDLSWLEKWAESNLVRFSKRNLAVLCLGRCYPMHQRGSGIKQWESSFAEKPPWGSWGTRSLLWASNLPWWQRPAASWAVSCRCILADHCQRSSQAFLTYMGCDWGHSFSASYRCRWL